MFEVNTLLFSFDRTAAESVVNTYPGVCDRGFN